MSIPRNAVAKCLMFISILMAVWSPLSSAEEVPLVDGKLWAKSSEIEKKAYIVGAGNFMSLEYQYQVKGQNPPTVDQSTVPAFYKHSEDVTLNAAIETVDRWYEKHPDKMDTPVLGVLWIELVKPNL